MSTDISKLVAPGACLVIEEVTRWMCTDRGMSVNVLPN